MSINIGIIDARIGKLSEDLADELDTRLNIRGDAGKAQSALFVYLVVKTLLDLPDEEALDCLTEGGNDFGVDAVHIGDVEDGEFVVSLFQGKYKQNLKGDANFPQAGIEKSIQAIRYLFDPDAAITINPNLARRLEEIRSLVRDGQIPLVRFVLCNNGLQWNAASQQLIDCAGFPKNQVEWQYINPDSIVGLMQSTKTIDDVLRLTGKAIVEDYDYSRVLVGKIPVQEIAALFNRHGDRLLERNVRRFLGLQGNRVNQAIAQTLAPSLSVVIFISIITVLRCFASSSIITDYKAATIRYRLKGFRSSMVARPAKRFKIRCHNCPENRAVWTRRLSSFGCISFPAIRTSWSTALPMRRTVKTRLTFATCAPMTPSRKALKSPCGIRIHLSSSPRRFIAQIHGYQ